MKTPTLVRKSVPIDTRALAALDMQCRIDNLSLNQKINQLLLSSARELPHFIEDPGSPENEKYLIPDNRGRKSSKKEQQP